MINLHATDPMTPAERAILHARYDGPIPATALADLRACPPQPLNLAEMDERTFRAWMKVAEQGYRFAEQNLDRDASPANLAAWLEAMEDYYKFINAMGGRK